MPRDTKTTGPGRPSITAATHHNTSSGIAMPAVVPVWQLKENKQQGEAGHNSFQGTASDPVQAMADNSSGVRAAAQLQAMAGAYAALQQKRAGQQREGATSYGTDSTKVVQRMPLDTFHSVIQEQLPEQEEAFIAYFDKQYRQTEAAGGFLTDGVMYDWNYENYVQDEAFTIEMLQDDIAEFRVYQEEKDNLRATITDMIINDNWNNYDLVSHIGSQPWSELEEAWNTLLHGNNQVLTAKMEKFLLVKLRGKPYDTEQPDDVVSYEGWPEVFMGEQSGHKWGTETEGGRIRVKLDPAANITDPDRLKEILTYFKRTAIVKTDYGNLAIDNVMAAVETLLAGKEDFLPLEVASSPIEGKMDPGENLPNVLKAEKRKAGEWPEVRKEGNKLAVKRGTPVALDKFNQYFITTQVANIMLMQQPQHLTMSGNQEDRLDMAQELTETSEKFKPGTSNKKTLSMKPKTSMEFLRHPSLTDGAPAAMEQMSHEIRKALRKELGEKTLFADELLNGMIIPKTGAPREIGGFTLTTPMTNAYPLLKLTGGGGGVSVLRERR